MLQQMLNYWQGLAAEWLMTIALPDNVWSMLGALFGGLGTLISWTPAVPYVPFTALSTVVSVVISSWALLFGIGMIITWATRLKP